MDMYEVDLESQVLKYLPLVERIASRISVKNTNYEYEDLYNIGVIGLIDSLKKYDPSKKVPFGGYASIRIKGAIIDEVRRHSKLPRYKMNLINEYYRAKEELESQAQHTASDEEIAAKMGIDLNQLGEIYDSMHYLASVSLEGTMFSKQEDQIHLADLLEDQTATDAEENLLVAEQKQILAKAIKRLTEREQLILSLYYQEEATLKEIAAVLDISIARVSQLHGKAIAKLRADIQKRQQNLSSNVANVNTSGYQQKHLFQAALADVRLHNYENGPQNDQYNGLVGGISWHNQISGAKIDTTMGALKHTERPTDFAINGDGYFVVQGPNNQQLYTKNGNFRLNQQNQLVTQEGYPVLGANGQAVTGTANPNLMVVTFNDNNNIQNLGATYYTTTGGVSQAQNLQVQAGYLVDSNVSMADAMTEMMQTVREFQSSQQVLSATNQTLDKAVNNLGKV